MKIGIYSPYFHILGGGERYLLMIAQYLSQKEKVTLFARPFLKKEAKFFLNIPLERVQFLPNEIFRTKNMFKKLILLFGFDIFLYMTDGSLFFPLARKNFLIVQSPVHFPPLDLFTRLKISNWRIICYSQFMKEILQKKFGFSSLVLPPAIDQNFFFLGDFSQKENVILTVGRFFSHLHQKKQDFLLEVFRKYYSSFFKNWRLIIAGGISDGKGEKVVEMLKKKSVGYPIQIFSNVSFRDLKLLYQKAKIYWHATGFGENLELFPEKAEHFGLSTLEAMASGCVPVVFNGGGQREIVRDGEDGFLWQTEEELVKKSWKIISNNTIYTSMAKLSQKRAENFSLSSFYEKLDRILYS